MGTAGKQPRGRVRVGKGTVLADDGSLLRMVHGYVHDHFLPYYTDVQWWRAMRDVGHFNTVRVMAFLGSWPKSTQVMDLKTLLPRLDGMVDLAAGAGLYLLIDNHSECCGNQDVPNDTAFWEAVAPRYKDRTHVFYELKNEPWQIQRAAGICTDDVSSDAPAGGGDAHHCLDDREPHPSCRPSCHDPFFA